MENIKKLKNTKGYENLEEILGTELGSLIYKVVDQASEWDYQLNVLHKHLSIIENTMTNICKDPVKIQINKALKECACYGKEYVEIKCPECLNDVEQEELDMFGGLCEECNSDLY